MLVPGIKKINTIYFGFNDPRIHARGVEYVIQSQSVASDKAYYIFLGARSEVFRWGKLVCIQVRRDAIWILRFNILVLRLRRRNPYAIIHAHNYLIALFLLCKIDIFTVHDSLSYLKKAMGKGSFIWGVIENIVYLKSNLIHYVSEYSKSMALLGNRTRHHVVIHNTCPRELPVHLQKDKKISELSFDNYALIVRSLEERAGIDMIISVAQKLKEQSNPLQILIAGKGPLLDLYRNIVISRGLTNLSFLGYVSDENLAELYKSAVFTITPALYGEGFGLPVIESYYFGKEAFASDVCALPEVVRDPRFLFKNTPDDVLSKIASFVSTATDKTHDDCIHYYQNKYGLDRYRKQFYDLYSNILSSRALSVSHSSKRFYS